MRGTNQMKPSRRVGILAAATGAAVLAASLLGAGAGDDALRRTGAFTTPAGEFELRLKIKQVETGRYGYPSTRCDYGVYRNGSFLHPRSLEGGTLIGCRFIGPDDVRIEPVGAGPDAVGWMLGVGGICGNTFSWKWTLIRPVKRLSEWEYEVETFLSAEVPVVRRRPEHFEVWSQYQEWGRTGTAASFYVPELRTVSRDVDESYAIRRAQLPADLDAWPELEYPSMIGFFVAGATQLNPELMVAAARRRAEDEPRHWAAQELSTDRREIAALIAKVHRAKELKEELRGFTLHWDERYE